MTSRVDSVILKVVWVIAALFGGVSLASCSMSQHGSVQETALKNDTESPLVVTVIPVVDSIGRQLVKNTPIRVSFLPPRKYSVNRVHGWVRHNSSVLPANADAVAGISAIWSGVDMYPALRERNIRVVPIDLAHALTPGGERVAALRLTNPKTGMQGPGYFWLNPANALLMTGVMARDLSALWPEHADQLSKNKAEINQLLRAIQIDIDKKLYDLGIEQVVVDNIKLTDLAVSLLLLVVSVEDARNNGLPTLYLTSKKRRKKTALLPSNFTTWSLDDFSKAGVASFTDRWQDNISHFPSN